jgi:hypothetical protein
MAAGAVSALPFQVIFEQGPPAMQRGFVHVFIPKLDLHIIVTHLHAHDAQQRIQECQMIVSHLRPYLDKSEKVKLAKLALNARAFRHAAQPGFVCCSRTARGEAAGTGDGRHEHVVAARQRSTSGTTVVGSAQLSS